MSETPPIACTLSPAELPGRQAEIRALGRDGLVAVAEEPDCCAFLDFTLEHDADAAVLTISAPNGGAEMVHELAAALVGR
jgi:hypothetical protein